MKKKEIEILLDEASFGENIRDLSLKILNNERINEDEALMLYRKFDLGLLGMLARYVKIRKSGENIFFNRNFHLEPTNVCVNHCRFCSYRRAKGEKGNWELSIEEMIAIVSSYKDKKVTEVHIVGGVHPDRDLHFYLELLKQIKKVLPEIQIKAFTAVEVDQMCKMAGIDIAEGLARLKKAGLECMPGGGAEIFDEQLRTRICPDKTSSEQWLSIHHEAHNSGISTNATILYGLFESYGHRIDHMNRLRTLQDQTKGFNAFIPLKFKNANNEYRNIKETIIAEDLRNYAVARIFLDNVPHLKAYWPMLGKEIAQMTLSFGVDDLDGTIDDSTKIYAMAGAQDQQPGATTGELVSMIKRAGFMAVERDSHYNELKIYP